ncbi:hypothetical protein [Geodermatophilus sp. SYSU D01105]
MSVPTSELVGELHPFNLEESRERARGRISLALLGVLFVVIATILGAALALVRPFNTEVLGLLLSGLLGPVVGLVGTVVGFYFGQESVQRRP